MLKMCKKFCGIKPWSVICGGATMVIIIMALLVVYRNVEAARTRRETIPLISTDFNPDPTAFSTQKIPKDPRFMCSIGNGHIATNVFSDTVYMNGLYNGANGESHRARIPAWCNVRLNSTLNNSSLKPIYTLNTTAGVFTVHVNREWSVVDQRIYTHRYYTRAIINQIIITAKHHAEAKRDHRARYVELSYLPGAASNDIVFGEQKEMKIGKRLLWTACGKTKIIEDSRYQENVTDVCAYWTYVPSHLVVPRRGKMLHTFVMTLDTNREVALKEMIDVLQETEDALFEKHCKEWNKIYDIGRIEINGNLQLEKTVNGIWYYLLSSLPSINSNQVHGLFYGLSPGGLSRGGLLKDYEGHNFWDTEIWMFPSILLLYPKYAESLLKYRIALMTAAYDLAGQNYNAGIRYPWESAFTGREVTQPCCPEVAEYEHHITGCISFAARQFIAVTEDIDWLKNGGCSFIYEMANFWASRVQFNDTTGFYDIRNVMGPDEDHSNVTNNAFTNVLAGYALYFAQYTTCLCKAFTLNKTRVWMDIAPHIALPYDPELDYHPQYDGYERMSKIKQADVTLMGFPLQYSMNRSTRANDLKYYENVTRESGPAMTWGMHSIGHLRIGNSQHASELFNKSYQGHVREPFKIWTEYQKPRIGAVNFMTGMGGFLQAIIFGYAGLSIHLDRLVIVKPQLLPQTTKLKISGIKYLGTEMTLEIHTTNISLTITKADILRPLDITMKSNKIALKKGIRLILHGDGPFKIQKKIPNDCPLPLDLIGEKKTIDLL